MRLDISDLIRHEICDPKRPTNHSLLSRSIRYRNPATGAVLIYSTTTDRRENFISILKRLGKPLKNDNAAPLAPAVSVGPCVKRLATPIWRQHSGLTEVDMRFRAKKEVYPGAQGEITLPCPYRLASKMGTHQGG